MSKRIKSVRFRRRDKATLEVLLHGECVGTVEAVKTAGKVSHYVVRFEGEADKLHFCNFDVFEASGQEGGYYGERPGMARSFAKLHAKSKAMDIGMARSRAAAGLPPRD